MKFTVFIDNKPSEELETNLESFIIGRSSKIDLKIDHPQVSRKHLEFSIEDKKIFVTELNSANGTKINGIKLIAGLKTEINRFTEILIGQSVRLEILSVDGMTSTIEKSNIKKAMENKSKQKETKPSLPKASPKNEQGDYEMEQLPNRQFEIEVNKDQLKVPEASALDEKEKDKEIEKTLTGISISKVMPMTDLLPPEEAKKKKEEILNNSKARTQQGEKSLSISNILKGVFKSSPVLEPTNNRQLNNWLKEKNKVQQEKKSKNKTMILMSVVGILLYGGYYFYKNKGNLIPTPTLATTSWAAKLKNEKCLTYKEKAYCKKMSNKFSSLDGFSINDDQVVLFLNINHLLPRKNIFLMKKNDFIKAKNFLASKLFEPQIIAHLNESVQKTYSVVGYIVLNKKASVFFEMETNKFLLADLPLEKINELRQMAINNKNETFPEQLSEFININKNHQNL